MSTHFDYLRIMKNFHAHYFFRYVACMAEILSLLRRPYFRQPVKAEMDSDSSGPVPGCSNGTYEKTLVRKAEARLTMSVLPKVTDSQVETSLSASSSVVESGTDSDED